MHPELKREILRLCQENTVRKHGAYYEIYKSPLRIKIGREHALRSHIGLRLEIKSDDKVLYHNLEVIHVEDCRFVAIGASPLSASQHDLLDIYSAMAAKVREQDRAAITEYETNLTALAAIRTVFGTGKTR